MAIEESSDTAAVPAVKAMNNALGGTGILATCATGHGIRGESTSSKGVVGTSIDYQGVYGHSNNNAGVVGESATWVGVYGKSASADRGAGVMGDATTGTGLLGTSKSGVGIVAGSETGEALHAETNSAAAAAVAGINNKSGPGVYGVSDQYDGVVGISRGSGKAGIAGRSDRGIGVFGKGAKAARFEGDVDVTGLINTSSMNVRSDFPFSCISTEENGTGAEVYGRRYGIFATCDGTDGAAVAGECWNGVAGAFFGKVHVYGSLEKTGGGFKIDHPSDPENKYLSHSFVESPTRLNLYDGSVVLDDSGSATVTLPNWFEHLNEGFRYQLTAIGSPAPNLHISAGIERNMFSIAGGEPNLEVCWQVTGTRKDSWASMNPLTVEEDKAESDRGKYIHPTLFGHPQAALAGIEDRSTKGPLTQR